jgi:hypothetical protein
MLVELAQFKCSVWRDHARVKRPEKANRTWHIWEAEPTFSKLFTLFSCCFNGARSCPSCDDPATLLSFRVREVERATMPLGEGEPWTLG